MNQKHQRILRKLRVKIVADLDVQEIIDRLRAKKILTVAKWQEIQKQSSSMSQNQMLLDYLPTRGPDAYSIFKEALREKYCWLSDRMDEMDTTEDCVDAWVDDSRSNIQHSLFPAEPPLSVNRAQKTEQLLNGLKDLKPGDYLALHALPGYGKSTLVSATLRNNKLITEWFQNEIYWIKFGQVQSESILILLNWLFHEVRDADFLTEATSEDSLKYFLKRHFAKKNGALLILDDVNDRTIIEAFDFGCKTLVLTTDIGILSGRKHRVIKMCDGFSSNESLDLISQAIGKPVSDLPPQARQIHDRCRGMPLMIAMYSAHFKEVKENLAEDGTSSRTWSYYCDTLCQGKSDVLQEPLERLETIFNMCIASLSPEDQKFYKMLAIFPEDVNITTKTLSIFWDRLPDEVDCRMLRFCKKSLACRQRHQSWCTYIYGVHILALDHLRNKLLPEELEELHRSYVMINLKLCDGDYSKLPTDNYIHSYIGYHMEKGGLTNKFSELYLNFGFIEARIFHIGPSNLLIDLKKYKNYITQGSTEILEKIEDLEKFLNQQASTLAEYRQRKCLDLVQVALRHPFPGFVRETAELLANKKQSSLYLNHLKHNTEFLNSSSRELHLHIYSVAFINEADVILVGDNKGKIISWNYNSGHYVTFFGNSCNHQITKIMASTNSKFFISISKDGTAKLFDFRADINKNKVTSRVKQLEWIESEIDQDSSRVTFSIPNQDIIDIVMSDDGKRIAACTNVGYIAMWDSNGNVLIPPQSHGQTPFSSIAFTRSSTFLHVVNKSTGALLMLDGSDGVYKMQFSLQPETDKIISLRSVPNYPNLLIVLLETKILRLSWSGITDIFSRPEIQAFAKLSNKTLIYTCAVITRDGKYIVIADTGGSVNIFDIHNEFDLVKTYKNFVSSIDTYWLKDARCYIICGGHRDTLVPMVHWWKFYPEEKPLVQRLPLFDATMELAERNVIAVATSNRTVQIIQNEDVIAETPAVNEEITSLVISDNENHVVYATETGFVYLFDIKLNHPKEIMHLSSSVGFMKILKIDNKDVIVCNEGTKNLQVWKSFKSGMEDTQLVENSGAVIFCDLLNSVQRILTIAETMIKVWEPNMWRLQSSYVSKNEAEISCCSLSEGQYFLALANVAGNLNILKLVPNQTRPSIKFQEYLNRQFSEEISACSFSHEEQFLAIGSISGEITVINLQTNEEIHKLQLHCQKLIQLQWGPSSDINEHILLSVTNELALWNVSLKAKKSTTYEITHSFSEQTISQKSHVPEMKTSKSLDLGSTHTDNNTSSNHDTVFDEGTFSSCSNSTSGIDLAESSTKLNGNDRNFSSSLWSAKIPKYTNIPGLLSVVKLDNDVVKKVCVSNDFKNFCTINGKGSIYNLTILDPPPKDNVNDDA